MKCFDEELIQQYIDGELTTEETGFVRQHLINCSECRNRTEQQRSTVVEMKAMLNHLVPAAEPEIPVFHKPEMTTIHKKKRNSYRHIWLTSAAAACLVAWIVFCPEQKETERESRFFYSIEGEYDANKTYLDQEINVIDENGQIVKFNL